MHPPPNDRPTGKKESDGEKNHADFREKRALPFLWRKKASFKKAKHGAHHQLQNNRQENEMPKLLPSSPTRKRCVLFKRLEEVVHLLYVNFLRLLAREPFLQLPPSTCRKVSSLRRSYPCSAPKTVRLLRFLSGLLESGEMGFSSDWQGTEEILQLFIYIGNTKLFSDISQSIPNNRRLPVWLFFLNLQKTKISLLVIFLRFFGMHICFCLIP